MWSFASYVTHQLENLTLMGLLGWKDELSETITSPICPALYFAYFASNSCHWQNIKRVSKHLKGWSNVIIEWFGHNVTPPKNHDEKNQEDVAWQCRLRKAARKKERQKPELQVKEQAKKDAIRWLSLMQADFSAPLQSMIQPFSWKSFTIMKAS